MGTILFEKSKKECLVLLREHYRDACPKADVPALDAIIKIHWEAIDATTNLTLAIAEFSEPELTFKVNLHNALRKTEIMPSVLKYISAQAKLNEMIASYEELYSSDWDNSDDADNCCVCSSRFDDICQDNYETMGDGEQCHYCGGRVCPDCIDHDAPHAIGSYELEDETVCKTCCTSQVKLRADNEQAEEDKSIADFEDHPE